MTSVKIYISTKSWKRWNRAVRRTFFEMVFCSLSTCSFLVQRGQFLPIPSVSSLLLVSPSTDDDTAQYVSEALAASKRDQQSRTATEIKNALREVRMRQETKELGFEDRVSAALSMLGILGH